MNKILLYVFLVLLYVGLPRNFSSHSSLLITDSSVFANYFTKAPVSVILIDQFTEGYFFKTYYQRYRLFHGLEEMEEVEVVTSRKFFNLNKNNIGLSIYRKTEANISNIPMPPGVIFLGNELYGNWKFDNSGLEVWHFHKAYDFFLDQLGWGEFRPDTDFFHYYKIHMESQKPFYGINNEFGTQGSVTRKNFSKYFEKKDSGASIREFVKNYLKIKF